VLFQRAIQLQELQGAGREGYELRPACSSSGKSGPPTGMQSQLQAEGFEAEPWRGAVSNWCSISTGRDHVIKLQPFLPPSPLHILPHMPTQAAKIKMCSQQPPLPKKFIYFMTLIWPLVIASSVNACDDCSLHPPDEQIFTQHGGAWAPLPLLLLQDTAELVFRLERKGSRRLMHWGFANFLLFILSTTLGDVVLCQHCEEEI